MRSYLLPLLLVLVSLGIGSWSFAQNMDDAACQKTIQTGCTQCHSTKRICDKLSDAAANWPETVKRMGLKGNLPQEVQDSVLNCLTKASEPGKFVCTK